MALTFNDEQAAALLEALGLPADTVDIETILATVKDAATASTADGAQPSAVAAAKQKIEASVDDAISKGKITPARRKHWVTLIEADPEMADVLASTPNETAIPMTEIGHGLDSDGRNPGADKEPGWFY